MKLYEFSGIKTHTTFKTGTYIFTYKENTKQTCVLIFTPKIRSKLPMKLQIYKMEC